MRLSIKTCTLDMPFAAMLDFCVAQGVQAVEIGTGNWSGAPHIDLDELLGSETARQRWMDQLRRRDIALCALNCSGNPLAFCDVIRQAGYEPVVYMNLHWAGSMYGMEELAHLPVWLASYGPVPALDRGVTLWQYSESGVVDGIEGPVDLDLWFTKE